MKRRTFLKSSTLLLPVIAAFPAQAFSVDSTHQPHQFTQKEVEDAVKKTVTDHIRKGSKFTWDGDFVKSMGMDSLDTVEVIMAVEKVFNTRVPDVIAERIRSPRQMADILFSGLNNAIVLYELPDYKGTALYLFADSRSQVKVSIGSEKGGGYDMFSYTGSIYKPKGYELILGGTVTCGKTPQTWEQKDLKKFLIDKGLPTTKVGMRKQHLSSDGWIMNFSAWLKGNKF